MERVFLFFTLICLYTQSFGQTSLHIGFDRDIEKYYPKTEDGSATYVMQLQRPQLVKGIVGKALDLSENAVLRKPVVLKADEVPAYSEEYDFSVQVWVKTLKGAQQGTPIIGNKKEGNLNQQGWSIFTQSNGAWGVNLSDGKNSFTYKTNAPRQVINDGEWHQVAFCLDREKGETWFYFDGKNVGIYDTPALGSLANENRTIAGGTDEYWEYGSFGQWTAFNGFIDEVSLQNKTFHSSDILQSYKQYKIPDAEGQLIAPLRVMVWNIWHGGRRYGKHVGVKRVVETIKQAQPDIVGLIETYGSGEIIADSLGYYFYLISSNLSIMSKFPIKETIKVFRPFNSGGVILDLGNNKQIAVVDTWLHYLPDYGKNVVERIMSSEELVKAEKKTRHSEVKQILKEIKPLVNNSNQTPVIMLGDFNSGSHLDWIETTKQIHYGYSIEWPVSKEMEQAGFLDSFRELNINPLLDPGLTWTPRAARSSTNYGLRDRIDFIYYKGNIRPIESKVIDYHPIMFPSDHAAVISVFEFE
ncbi:MAG: endonuclease/exonuclease/phosphatase family protein [Marinilabiliaceae bacterium]|nr:endonuclease/exonuclease/phosphatase family protein [Marinilabiliaceae bacterium]